jgi:hypothetical protein
MKKETIEKVILLSGQLTNLINIKASNLDSFTVGIYYEDFIPINSNNDTRLIILEIKEHLKNEFINALANNIKGIEEELKKL